MTEFIQQYQLGLYLCFFLLPKPQRLSEYGSVSINPLHAHGNGALRELVSRRFDEAFGDNAKGV